MNEVELSIFTSFFSLLICIIYFSKKHFNYLENKVFSLMIITGLVDSILLIIKSILIKNIEFQNINNFENYILEVLTKTNLSILIILANCIFLYTVSIYLKRRKKLVNDIKNITILSSILGALLTFVLNVNLLCQNNKVILNGTSLIPSYALCIIYSLLTLITIILNRKNKLKRNIVIISSIMLFLYNLYNLAYNTNIIENTILIILINYLIYYTLENQDVKMIKELELAKNNAEKANNAKTEFLSSMSHEIRTPLNAIVGFSNAILEDNTIEQAKEEAKDIIYSCNNLLEVMNGILNISKIESGNMEINNIDYKMKDIYEEVVKLIEPRIKNKKLKLITNYSQDIPYMLNGDANKIKEIITNLMTNAVKYTDVGTIELNINSYNKKDTALIEISVSDTGIGISKENQEKIFNKFDRNDNVKNSTITGTGLGLAITKNLTEMLNGKITLSSKEKVGSTFKVTIPQKIKILNSIVENQKEETNQTKDFSNKKILIVDDNKLNIKVASRLLQKYNLQIDSCLSGTDCLEKIKTNKYDLIFMDDMMPEMSGVETFYKLKENSLFKTPVVMLTANAITGMKEKYLSYGLNDYLAKPIDRIELDRVLDEYLKNR